MCVLWKLVLRFCAVAVFDFDVSARAIAAGLTIWIILHNSAESRRARGRGGRGVWSMAERNGRAFTSFEGERLFSNLGPIARVLYSPVVFATANFAGRAACRGSVRDGESNKQVD